MAGKGKWDNLGGIGGDAVKKKTGRGWAEWIAVLDKAGARAMDHKQIVQLLKEKFGVGSWWQQMVTVGYEQARGKREAHQTPRGYQVGASKTVSVSVEELFAAWENARTRARWLAGSPLVVRKATPNKSLRASWKHDGSSVDVNFYTKGERKSQIGLQHTRLSGSGQVIRMQSFWREALGQLKKMLEG